MADGRSEDDIALVLGLGPVGYGLDFLVRPDLYFGAFLSLVEGSGVEVVGVVNPVVGEDCVPAVQFGKIIVWLSDSEAISSSMEV